MINRKFEYFEPNKIEKTESLSQVPPFLFPQERDWTCSLACIRTMLSGVMKDVPKEEVLVQQYKMDMGPYYSKDLKKLGILDDILSKEKVIYGCDQEDIELPDILTLMENGYYVMLESMVNYAHWMVLLGYFVTAGEENPEKCRLLFYDPYYNQVKLLNYDEFMGMWIDGNFAQTGVTKDFIAICG